MARQCHLNSCPAGIATQRPELRAKFRGKPEQVERFFLLLAADVRGHLARLGLRSIEEAVGRTDLLRQVDMRAGLDLSPLLASPVEGQRRSAQDRNDPAPRSEPLWDHTIVADALAAVAAGERYVARRAITNEDRSFGARLGGALALEHGGAGVPDGSIDLTLEGSAGQSFGAFCGRGIHLTLEGEANDYVGKGLSGAEIVLRPAAALGSAMRGRGGPSSDATASGVLAGQVLLGNVALYGATSGRLFAAGVAGERFGVRNSGADAVVEGIGEHGCEYMTGGCVVVLGSTGGNFGAGMTGGIAFVYDRAQSLPDLVNAKDVGCEAPSDADFERLLGILAEHVERTGSARATTILNDWPRHRAFFWKVLPLAAAGPEDEEAESTGDSERGVVGSSSLGA